MIIYCPTCNHTQFFATFDSDSKTKQIVHDELACRECKNTFGMDWRINTRSEWMTTQIRAEKKEGA